MADMSLSERLDYLFDSARNLLIINNDSVLPSGRRLAFRITDPAEFNRVCGPLLSATADPLDRAFSAQVSVSADMISVSATFSRQMRHTSALSGAFHPAVLLLFRRDGDASLQIGSARGALDLAVVGPDVDFAVLADPQGGTCSVGCICLRDASGLGAHMPYPAIMPQSAGGDPRSDPTERLRRFAESVIGSIAEASPAGADAARDAMDLSRLIRDQLACGQWSDCRTWDGSENQPAGGRDLVLAVQRFLRQHASDAELTPARIASHCAVSVRKLYNAFASADMSLRATVLRYRLEEARRQLNTRTVKKVTSIAYDTGFRDVSTFYRNFRREFGFSPRENAAAAAIRGLAREPAPGIAGGDAGAPRVGIPATTAGADHNGVAPSYADHSASPAGFRNGLGTSGLGTPDPPDDNAIASGLPRDPLFHQEPPRDRGTLLPVHDRLRGS